MHTLCTPCVCLCAKTEQVLEYDSFKIYSNSIVPCYHLPWIHKMNHKSQLAVGCAYLSYYRVRIQAGNGLKWLENRNLSPQTRGAARSPPHPAGLRDGTQERGLRTAAVLRIALTALQQHVTLLRYTRTTSLYHDTHITTSGARDGTHFTHPTRQIYGTAADLYPPSSSTAAQVPPPRAAQIRTRTVCMHASLDLTSTCARPSAERARTTARTSRGSK